MASNWRHDLPIRRLIIFACGIVLIPVGLYFLFQQRRLEDRFQGVQALIDRYDFARAIEKLHVLRKETPEDARVRFLLGQTLRRTGQDEEATAQLRKAKDLGWPEADVITEMLLIRAATGDRDVVMDLRSMLTLEGSEKYEKLIYEVLIAYHVQSFELDAAADCIEKLLKLEPTNSKAWISRGYVQEKRFLFGAAVEDYRKAVELAPDDIEARTKLAEVLLITGPPDQALTEFDWLRQREVRPEYLLGAGKAKRQVGDFDQAKALLDEVISRAPRMGAAWIERGTLLFQQQKLAEAEQDLRKGIELAPGERHGRNTLAQCLERQNKTKEANDERAAVQKLDDAYKRLGQLTKQAASKPADPDLRQEVGSLFLTLGETREGLRWLEEALRRDPRHAATHAALASYLEKAGRSAEAAVHRKLAAAKK